MQIGEALVEAHAHQIVHRDLKPQNVMVAPDGWVKILDFGLAKLLQVPRPDDEVMTQAATQSAEMTLHGHILGTVACMSPEQAVGAPVDSRSDVFAFGTLLYELATAQWPFRGQTVTSTLAKILEADPPPASGIRAGLPVDFERIVRRCLQKKPADRLPRPCRSFQSLARRRRDRHTQGHPGQRTDDRHTLGSAAKLLRGRHAHRLRQ